MGGRHWALTGLLCTSLARAEGLPCSEDGALSETAASLILRGGPVQPQALLAEARANGFDGVSVHAREGEDDGQLVDWMATFASEGKLVCGEARGESRRLLLVSSRGGTLTREGGRLRVALEAGFSAPSLVLESHEGELTRMPLSAEKLRAGVIIPRPAQLKRVQLIAEGASGPRPLAELSLQSREAVEPSRSLAVPREAGPEEGPRTRPLDVMLGRLTSFRRDQGLGELRDNRLLSESAQRHAARICELGRLAHRLDGEDPETRLRREHIGARHVGEVLARAESSDRAFQALLDSPSHRLALTRREFTDAGVGQAADKKGQVCLVVLLASWPRRLP